MLQNLHAAVEYIYIFKCRLLMQGNRHGKLLDQSIGHPLSALATYVILFLYALILNVYHRPSGGASSSSYLIQSTQNNEQCMADTADTELCLSLS